MPFSRRDPTERLAAWVYTGPLGHFWSVFADVTSMWPRYLAAAAARRLTPRR